MKKSKVVPSPALLGHGATTRAPAIEAVVLSFSLSPLLAAEVAETDDELPHALPPKPTAAVKGTIAAAAPVAVS